ncbi:hypothetical protein APHAL10511_003152, partial [Amanita phalloides]
MRRLKSLAQKILIKRRRKEETNAVRGDGAVGEGLAAGPSMLSNATCSTIDRSSLTNVRGNMVKTTIHYNYHLAGVTLKANVPSTSAGGDIGAQIVDTGATNDDTSKGDPRNRRRSNDLQHVHACGVQVVPPESTTTEESRVDSSTQELPTGYKKVVLEVSLDELEHLACTDMLKELMTSTAERYTRLQLRKRLGYPLYLPEPDCYRPLEYRKKGISVGDVGRVTSDGYFDFLFNACLPAGHPANPSVLPDGYEPIIGAELSKQWLYGPTTGTNPVVSENIQQIGGMSESFRCTASEGAVLVLPDGAVLVAAEDKDLFREFASRHAKSLYCYMNQQRRRRAPNGSLYIITGCIKSESWGIATFDRQSQPDDHLKFVSVDVPMGHPGCMSVSGRKYYWKQKGLSLARVGPNDIVADGVEMLNQCTFLRGYKVTLHEDVWEQLVESIHVSVTDASGYQGHYPTLARDQDAANEKLGQAAHGEQTTPTSGYGVKHVTVEDDWGVSDAIHAIHPSTYINLMLLQMVPHVKVAITHDDEWCGIQHEDMSSLLSDDMLSASSLLKKVIISHDIMVDGHSTAFLTHKAQLQEEHVVSPEKSLVYEEGPVVETSHETNTSN